MSTLPEFEGQHPAGRRLRPASGAPPGLRGRRLAQQPDLSAGSLRHLRHEGGDQRRAQPVGARWLVGRRLRQRHRQATAGRSSRPQPTSTTPGATPKKRARCTNCSRTTSSRLLPKHRSPDGLLAGLGGDGQALDRDHLAALQHDAHGQRVRARSSTRRPPATGAASPPTILPSPERRRVEGPGARRLVRRSPAPPRQSERRIPFGSHLKLEVAVQLNGLAPEDVTVEALFGRPGHKNFMPGAPLSR